MPATPQSLSCSSSGLPMPVITAWVWTSWPSDSEAWW